MKYGLFVIGGLGFGTQMRGSKPLLFLFKHSNLPFLFRQREDSSRQKSAERVISNRVPGTGPAQRTVLVLMTMAKVTASVLLAGVV